jgi:hypothetical protein
MLIVRVVTLIRNGLTAVIVPIRTGSVWARPLARNIEIKARARRTKRAAAPLDRIPERQAP